MSWPKSPQISVKKVKKLFSSTFYMLFQNPRNIRVFVCSLCFSASLKTFFLQTGHISVRSLCFLKLLKLKKTDCLHFFHCWPLILRFGHFVTKVNDLIKKPQIFVIKEKGMAHCSTLKKTKWPYFFIFLDHFHKNMAIQKR